jgi:hypothetical protein
MKIIIYSKDYFVTCILNIIFFTIKWMQTKRGYSTCTRQYSSIIISWLHIISIEHSHFPEWILKLYTFLTYFKRSRFPNGRQFMFHTNRVSQWDNGQKDKQRSTKHSIPFLVLNNNYSLTLLLLCGITHLLCWCGITHLLCWCGIIHLRWCPLYIRPTRSVECL